MKLLLSFILIQWCFIAPLTHAYTIINRDYILLSEQVRINFSPSVYKKEAEVSFQTCSTCPWKSYQVNEKTEFYNKKIPVDFLVFKKQVKSDEYNPPSQINKVYISINNKSNEVFNIWWNYVER